MIDRRNERRIFIAVLAISILALLGAFNMASFNMMSFYSTYKVNYVLAAGLGIIAYRLARGDLI